MANALSNLLYTYYSSVAVGKIAVPQQRRDFVKQKSFPLISGMHSNKLMAQNNPWWKQLSHPPH